MTSNSIATTFNGTCVPIQLPCRTGSRYVDPCDCKFYYLCRDRASIIRQPCAPGTAYDHTSASSVCNRFQDVVFGGICDQLSPWDRCTDKHANVDLDKLERWCSGSGYFTPAPTRQKADDETNGGLIAAIIITLIIIIAVVVLIVIYVRRKGNPVKHIKQTRFWRRVISREGREYNNSNCNSTQSTPRYSVNPTSPDCEEETYTEIDDTAVNNGDGTGRRRSSFKKPVSIEDDVYDRADEGAVGRRRSTARKSVSIEDDAYDRADEGAVGRRRSTARKSVSIEDDSYDRADEAAVGRRRLSSRKSVSIEDDVFNEEEEEEEGAVGGAYDNSAFDERDTPPPDTENHPAPPAYFPRVDDSGETPRSYTSLSENEGAIELHQLDHDTDSIQPTVDDDGYLTAHPVGQSLDPTYYELEKEEHSLDNSFHA